MSHFQERRHRWAVDTGDGALLGLGFPWHTSPLDTALFRTKDEAKQVCRQWRDEVLAARVVKVAVRLEVLL